MSYVFYLIVLFVLLILAGVYFILRYQRARQLKLRDKVFYLKTFGKQLRVPMSDCGMAHKVFYDERDGQKIPVDVCLVTFESAVPDGKTKLYKSAPLYITPERLQQWLEEGGKGVLYYQSDNTDHHYLELPFAKQVERS